MDIQKTAIDGVLIIRPPKFEDRRGYFAPVFRQSDMEAAGISHGWVQENQSLSRMKGTVRGLHYQLPPYAQAKLVRVVRGSALDVCVDLRPGSSTFGRHVALELTAENLTHIYIPAGFGHGFCTLTADTEVLYKVSTGWSPAHERGIRWNDPALGINWPISEADATLSDKDQAWPMLAQADPAI